MVKHFGSLKVTVVNLWFCHKFILKIHAFIFFNDGTIMIWVLANFLKENMLILNHMMRLLFHLKKDVFVYNIMKKDEIDKYIFLR